MINEERTKMMTRLALYETKEGKKELKITRYSPGDYVMLQMLWSFICGTVAFVIIGGLAALYNIETLMLELFSMDILLFARNILVVYIIFIACYLMICYSYYSYRYGRYKKRVNAYIIRLKELYKHYVQNGNNQNM